MIIIYTHQMYYATLAMYLAYAAEFLNNQKNAAVAKLREWLGPAPQDYYLLLDGRIISCQTVLPLRVAITAFVFNTERRQFSPALHPRTGGRWKPAVPYLAMTIKTSEEHDVDISEWIADLRIPRDEPAPFLSIKQIVELWARVHNQYLPNAYTLYTINSDGNEIIIDV